MIKCLKCNTKNEVIEIAELKDIKQFQDRTLIISKCKVCNCDIAELIEFRKKDGVAFVERFSGAEATKIIKRESARFKNKSYYKKQYNSWVYGVNTQIRNKKGEVVKIRQYSSDFKGKKVLEKELCV